MQRLFGTVPALKAANRSMSTSYQQNNGFSQSSKNNPCPVCDRTKDGDCRISPDGKLVLCHRNINHERTPQTVLNSWHYLGESTDRRCGKYILKEDDRTEKSIRPAQTRDWEYPARDGSKLVRVKRVDDGKGKKKIWQERWDGKGWVKGLDGIDRADIPPYRYAEVKKAIAENKLIFIAEGEPAVDLLWDLGLAATCNIGGSGKWQSSDTSDLASAQVVIVPDRDEPGIKHADSIAQEFPDAMWLYAFPDSAAWGNLPKSQGLDVADWIESHKLTKEEILAAVGERKQETAAPAPSAKILSHPKFEAPSLDNLAAEIDELLAADLKRSELKIKLAGLTQKFRLNPSEVEKIYRDREQELEQEADREDVATEVARLLGSKKSQIDIAEIIPPALAKPIAELAARLNLRPECYLTTLLTQASSLFKVGTEVKLRNDTDYRVTPNYFAGIIAESSQKKSPIMRAIIDRPMQSLRDKARKEYEKAVAQYESDHAAWKAAKGEDKGLPPKPPRQKLYSFSKTTGEGILYQVAEHPDQALMYRCDELAGLFKSANQYRGGKGSDDEDLLEFWNGTGSTVLRASGVKADLDGLLLSVFGTIQPDVLAALLKDCSDSNGKFARFDFVIQPLAASKLSLEDSGSFDVTPMLTDLYQKIDALPAIFFELDRDAKRYFTEFYNAAEDRRVAEPMQGKRAAIGKAPEKVGKLATVIHTLSCVFNSQPVTCKIPKQAVQAAIKFVMFAASQVDVLYTEFSDRTALAPNLAKIIALAERKGGTVSAREAQLAFPFKQRPTAQQMREWFAELDSMKYGEITKTGKTTSFVLTTIAMTTVGSNQSIVSSKADYSQFQPLTTMTTVNSTTVVNRSHTVVKDKLQLESLSDKELEPTVVTVVTNSPPLENSNGLMMSCTTEPPPEQPIESVQNHPPVPDFEVGDRVEIVGSPAEHYNGVTGKVVNTYFGGSPVERWHYVVEFDSPVGAADFLDFPAYELRRLGQ